MKADGLFVGWDIARYDGEVSAIIIGRLKAGVVTVESLTCSRANPDLVAWYCRRLLEMYEGVEQPP